MNIFSTAKKLHLYCHTRSVALFVVAAHGFLLLTLRPETCTISHSEWVDFGLCTKLELLITFIEVFYFFTWYLMTNIRDVLDLCMKFHILTRMSFKFLNLILSSHDTRTMKFRNFVSFPYDTIISWITSLLMMFAKICSYHNLLCDKRSNKQKLMSFCMSDKFPTFLWIKFQFYNTKFEDTEWKFLKRMS